MPDAMATRTIPLSKGYVAIVDDADFERLSRFKWSVSISRHQPYAVRLIRDEGKPRRIYMHREIMAPEDGEIVDHVNGQTLDNRRANLRISDRGGNQQNCISRTGASQYKGVSWHEIAGKWQAHIGKGGKKHYLGVFRTEEAAAAAYNKKALELFGEFARLNEIPDAA